MKKQKEVPEAEEERGKETIKINPLLIGMAIVYIALGVLLAACVPNVLSLTQLCYLLAAVIMGTGVFLIVRYFMKEAYKNLREYGFSVGVILVAAGVIAVARAESIQGGLLYIFGALILIAATFKFQNSLDLKALKDPYWYVWLAIASVIAVLGVLSVINPFGENLVALSKYTAAILIVDGIVTIVGTIYLYRRIKKYLAKEEEPETPELPPKNRSFFLKPGPDELEEMGITPSNAANPSGSEPEKQAGPVVINPDDDDEL